MHEARTGVVDHDAAVDLQPGIRGEEGAQDAFIGAMHNVSAPNADEVIRAVQPLQFRHLLDIGGASGTWTMAFLCACPSAQATLFDLPHAETHTVLLPHTIAYNTPAASEALGRAAAALGADDAATGVFELEKRLKMPLALAEIGMPEDGIERAAELAVKNPYWNPRAIERDAIRDLLQRAWSGARPQSN